MFSVDRGIKSPYYVPPPTHTKVVIFSVHVHAFMLTFGKLGRVIFHALFTGNIVHAGIVHNTHTTLITPISARYYLVLRNATTVY